MISPHVSVGLRPSGLVRRDKGPPAGGDTYSANVVSTGLVQPVDGSGTESSGNGSHCCCWCYALSLLVAG